VDLVLSCTIDAPGKADDELFEATGVLARLAISRACLVMLDRNIDDSIQIGKMAAVARLSLKLTGLSRHVIVFRYVSDSFCHVVS
jgi:hypothetical protein